MGNCDDQWKLKLESQFPPACHPDFFLKLRWLASGNGCPLHATCSLNLIGSKITDRLEENFSTLFSCAGILLDKFKSSRNRREKKKCTAWSLKRSKHVSPHPESQGGHDERKKIFPGTSLRGEIKILIKIFGFLLGRRRKLSGLPNRHGWHAKQGLGATFKVPTICVGRNSQLDTQP